MNTLLTASAGLVSAWITVNVVTSIIPVVAFMKAVPEIRTAEIYRAEVFGYKPRGCNLVKGSMIGWHFDGKVWVEDARLTFPDDQTPDSTRPGSFERQSFGLWQWEVTPQTTKVRATAQHSCDGSQPFTTIIGPFDVPVVSKEKT